MPQPFITNLYQQFNLSKREIDLVLCHVLAINTAGLFIYDNKITEHKQQHIMTLLQKRAEGVPLAYLTGHKAFWTLELFVNEHTLIPRPETELIIELLLQWCSDDFCGTLLDLGTGSGAIALSFAHNRPQAQVTAVDFSKPCVDVAKKNQHNYQLNNVKVQHSDWFNNLGAHTFDYIVSNPPYIAENDEHLAALKHEPITALTAKKNGLADLYHIIEHAPNHLNNNGRILLEHGYNQHLEVQQHLQAHGYSHINSHLDLTGINRVTSAVFSQR